MFHHKLGWQTSDQQDKAVSCEVGVLLVLASSIRQCVWGWGALLGNPPVLLRGPDDAWGLSSSCCHGPAPEPGPGL